MAYLPGGFQLAGRPRQPQKQLNRIRNINDLLEPRDAINPPVVRVTSGWSSLVNHGYPWLMCEFVLRGFTLSAIPLLSKGSAIKKASSSDLLRPCIETGLNKRIVVNVAIPISSSW